MCHDPASHPPVFGPALGPVASTDVVVLTSSDGSRFSAFHAVPSQLRGTSVLVLPDNRGLTGFYEDLCVRLAEQGHPALAIDYYGRTAGTDHRRRGPEFAFMEHLFQVSRKGLFADIRAGIDALRDGGNVVGHDGAAPTAASAASGAPAPSAASPTAASSALSAATTPSAAPAVTVMSDSSPASATADSPHTPPLSEDSPLSATSDGDPAEIAVLGFCFGGRQAFLTAAPEFGVRGVIGFYGFPDVLFGAPGPTQLAADLTAPVLALFGGADEGITTAHIAAFDQALSHLPHEIVTYPGMPHSFFDIPGDDPNGTRAAACTDAWRRVLDFLA